MKYYFILLFLLASSPVFSATVFVPFKAASPTVTIIPDFGLTPSTRVVFIPVSPGAGSSLGVGLKFVDISTHTEVYLKVDPFKIDGGTTIISQFDVTYMVIADDAEVRFIVPNQTERIFLSTQAMQTVELNIGPNKTQKSGKYRSKLFVTVIDK